MDVLQLLSIFVSICIVKGKEKLPNIVIFLADDLGMGDVGCFGNTTLSTPHIDSIARQGVRLTQHLTAAPTCSPSRAALLTGRLPKRYGFDSPLRMTIIPFVACTSGLPSDEVTFAEIAKQAGYKTAFIGKWHVGTYCDNTGDPCHHPLRQGFDYFYGLPLTNLKDFGDDGNSVITTFRPTVNYEIAFYFFIAVATIVIFKRKNLLGFYTSTVSIIILTVFMLYVVFFVNNIKMLNSILMRNYEVVEQPVHLETITKKLVQDGRQFLQEQAKGDQPFLLFMSWTQVHTALRTSEEFYGSSQHGLYGDAVQELDWGVGQVLETLNTLGLQDNTFIYFSSDNGGHVEEKGLDGSRQGGFNGIYRGGKLQGSMDGGIRVPSAVMWPGQLPAGVSIEEMTSQMDLLPTLAHMMRQSLPGSTELDGKNLLPLLKGEKRVSPHQFLFHYCAQDLHAVRYQPRDGSATWKLIYASYNWLPGTEGCGYTCSCYVDAVWHSPPLLYDVKSDPSEKTAVSPSTAQYQNLLAIITKAVAEHSKTFAYVESQFSTPKLLWRPWLQDCCNFPYCNCADSMHQIN
ncbi:steryl-sulfatase [Lingula anatina]|uniref:Steryl-sulfatase n=1 Tax=Lingula anatina TaxID=7574 RepID=A0A1S3JWM2_LINAN|nr:steryl-sulfatase [Lingula anatina]XP_013414824.1 steryl-sulfatase [Lingula anatina]XP_013414825.1 steryl-sulfatase [Lingula anatina]XP_013414828.1 steryl-sulfatase [Lingula anatina]|eukprot:XP_013414823.1 steryl-sulfatase [Lingula anatina]